MKNINELIKDAMKEYMQASVETKNEKKLKLDTIKLLKTAMMEYATNKKNSKQFDINDNVNIRITKIPNDIQINIISKMIKERNNNVDIYNKAGRSDMANKEKQESIILESLLPKAASKEDIENFIKNNYPNNYSQKEMGIIIKQILNTFEYVDRSLVANVVKSHINNN